jgi:CRP/FNR family transcriptional regulator, cyclic AMP receptor protein
MRLDIYVAKQHQSLQEVRAVAAGASKIADLEIFLIPADDKESIAKFAAIAPLYVLNDQLLAWGISSVEALLALLRRRSRLAAAQLSQVHPCPHPTAPPAHPFPLAASTTPLPLLTLDVLQEVDGEALRALCARMPQRTYAAGRFIFWQGEAAHTTFLLRQGQVQLSRLTKQGRRWDLGQVRPGTFFGEAAVLDKTTYFTSAEVVEESLVWVLSHAQLEEFLREQPTVALRISRSLSQRLLQNTEQLEGALFRDAAARLAANLIQQSHEANTSLLWLTHEQLGASAGLLRETVTKLLDLFQQAGLVRLRRNQVQLLEFVGLQALLEVPDTGSFLRHRRNQAHEASETRSLVSQAG